MTFLDYPGDDEPRITGHPPNPRADLVEDIRLAHLALAKHDLAMAESEHWDALRDCRCSPDIHEYDPHCRVAYHGDAVERARAEVNRWSK